MRPDMLARIGSPNIERIGAALHSAELRHMAQDRTEPREIGHRRINLWQCLCLRWNRRYIVVCEACGRTPGATK
jgi:hypothetical protein